MLEFIKQPWHWSIAGVLIGLTVPALLLMGNKSFGISSNLRHLCAMCLPKKIPFFNYDWKKESWNLFFVLGVTIGAFIASTILKNEEHIKIAESTKNILAQYNVKEFAQLMPTDIFNFKNVFSLKGFIFFVLGGFLVGFGTRYANGCTSGHAIFGISTFQWPSLVATICFMLGGILCTHFILPLIFKII